jgi:hypothetical protein
MVEIFLGIIGFTDAALRKLEGLSERRRVYLVEPSG